MRERQFNFVVIILENFIIVFAPLRKNNFEIFRDQKLNNISEVTLQNYFSTCELCIQKNIFLNSVIVLIDHCDQLVYQEKPCNKDRKILSHSLVLFQITFDFSKTIFVCSQEPNFVIENFVVSLNYSENNFIEKLIQKNFTKNKKLISFVIKCNTCCKLNNIIFENKNFVFVNSVMIQDQNKNYKKILISNFKNLFGFGKLSVKNNSISNQTKHNCDFVKQILNDLVVNSFSFLCVYANPLECVDHEIQFHMLNKIKNKSNLPLFNRTIEEINFKDNYFYDFEIYFFKNKNYFSFSLIKNVIPKFSENFFHQFNNYSSSDIVLLDNTTTNISYAHASLVVLLDNTTTNISYAHASLVVLLDNTTTNISYASIHHTLNHSPGYFVSISLQLLSVYSFNRLTPNMVSNGKNMINISSSQTYRCLNCLSATANTTLNQYNPHQHNANPSDSAVSEKID